MAVVRQGRRYRLGRTEAYGAIWRRHPWGWRLVARYPLTGEGWRIAEGQFSLWEPDLRPGPVGASTEAAALGAEQGLGRDTPPVGTPAVPAAPAHQGHGWLKWAAVVVVVLILGTAAFFIDGILTKAAPASTKTPVAGSAKSRSYTLPPVGGGWLAHGGSWVMFIQWSATHGKFSGTAQYARLSGTAPNLRIATTSLPLTGTLRGHEITITFVGEAEQFGRIQKGRFTMNVPQTNGTLFPVTFVAVSAVRYNHVISGLRARVVSANTRAAQAEARAKAETAINQTASAVSSDIRVLATDETTLKGAVASVAATLGTETTALATERAALARVNSCYGASGLNYDSSGVAYDASQVGYAANKVSSDITGIKTEISTLKTQAATLLAQERAFPGYIPPTQPVTTAATRAEASAQAAVAAAVSTTNGYIGQANADMTAADTVASQADRKGGCTTSTLTAPTPISPITG